MISPPYIFNILTNHDKMSFKEPHHANGSTKNELGNSLNNYANLIN